MTVVACPECESTFHSWFTLGTHFWEDHTHVGANEESSACPHCDYPLSETNVLYHLACFTEIEPEAVWIGLSIDGSLCAICGEPFSSREPVSDHISSHSGADVKAILADELVCSVCGESPEPGDRFSGHIECLVNHLAISRTFANTYQCPCCDVTGAHEGEVEWHLWTEHFDAAGFETTCPGCEEVITYGNVKQHLLCLDRVHGPAAARLMDLRFDGCFLCDMSFYNPQVLHRHISSNHANRIQSIDGACRECGDSIEDGGISLHYLCLASAFDAQLELDPQPSWRCPLCSTPSIDVQEFIEHLEMDHDLELFNADSCLVCGDSLNAASGHEACLDTLTGFDSDALASIGLSIPPVLLHRPERTEFTPEYPIPESNTAGYYRDLDDFVERERESAREESWRRYDEIPLEQLRHSENVILNLTEIGSRHNPHVELQFVFERPVPEHEHDPEDLTTRFGIYPRQKVIVGADSSLNGLPMEATVTFTDGQSIGLSPEPDRNFSESELRSIFTNSSANYHVVDLLNPTPFDRKRTAIRDVRTSSHEDNLVTGRRTATEYPRSIGSVYAGQLNARQELAVGRALGEPTVCCIHGPPGTGKTRTLTAVIELAVARGDRVLACAHSNQAIDNLLVGSSTLEEPDQKSLHGLVDEVAAVEMARAGNHSGHPVVQRNYQGLEVDRADIVGSTTSAAAELDADSFDLVIIDEATQADQPASFIPLLRGDNIVLAGDHKQLPPFCSDETARQEEMHISLFEHLRNTYGDQISTQLRRQYRMNERIAAFPSRAFYHDSLVHGEENRNWQISDLRPFVGHQIAGQERTREESRSKYNTEEAEIVAQQVRLLQMHDVDNSEIGVITAYSAQINEIQQALRRERIYGPEEIEIDTIDSFQGAEREAIVVSFVRSNDYGASGFLTFPDEGKRRLNVALTRAKKRLVLVGDFSTLGVIPDGTTSDESCAAIYHELYEYLQDLESIQNHS